MSTDVTITGRVVKEDPSLTFANSGTAVARFTVVSSGRKLNKVTDQWEDVDTTFYRVTAFGPLAENIAEYIERGTAVILKGKLSQDDWTDKQGNTRTSIKVVANSLGEDLRWRKTQGSNAAQVPEDEDPPF